MYVGYYTNPARDFKNKKALHENSALIFNGVPSMNRGTC